MAGSWRRRLRGARRTRMMAKMILQMSDAVNGMVLVACGVAAASPEWVEAEKAR